MLNNVTLLGRLCTDVEIRTTSSGKSVANFRIAVDRAFSKDGNRQADFITIVAWGSTALFVSRYFSKGSMIAIQGRIQTRNYEDSNGNKRTAFEVVANEVSFCGGKNETTPTPSQAALTYQPAPNFVEIPDTEEDLPF
ncbi:MAG: single-stranded DNA-binding protein [Acutalibacteraceae bacterium]|nr:single-stranded DNA-binding protein [Acutalibacteraceae bacterium]